MSELGPIPAETTGENRSAAAAVDGKGATIGELRAALPKATPEFLLESFAAGETVAAAVTRYIAESDARVEALEAKARAKGARPLGSGPALGPRFSAADDARTAESPVVASWQPRDLEELILSLPAARRVWMLRDLAALAEMLVARPELRPAVMAMIRAAAASVGEGGELADA